MPSKTEALALHLMRQLYASTGGRPMQWRSLAGISDGSETQEAVQVAPRGCWPRMRFCIQAKSGLGFAESRSLSH